MGPLLAIFPHPDDETFTAGGLMAAAIERGLAVTLICATRGEAGESSIPDLGSAERLGAVREEELRDAMRHLGVTDVRFLGYRDSGMEGSAEADDDRAFTRVPLDQAAAEIAESIRAIRPAIIVTFGAEGIYGHPDHIHLHHVVTRAVLLAGDPVLTPGASGQPWQTPRLYFGTAPREDMVSLLNRPDGPFTSLSETARANLGTPLSDITDVIDTRPWSDAKRAALTAHRSQTGVGGPLGSIPEDVLVNRMTREYFVRAPLPWAPSDADADLIDRLQMIHPAP